MKANLDINERCKRFSNVKVLDISNVSRTAQNRKGKECITVEISKITGNDKKIHSYVIVVSISKQGNY
jgi:hypothetical protein